MRAKQLNSDGIRLFENFLDNARNKPADQSTIAALKSDPSYTEPNTYNLEVTPQSFSTTKDVAIYMCQQIDKANLRRPPEDPGLWSWLAIYFSNSILPADTKGSIAILENARYICSDRWNRKYRHRVAGPTRALWYYRTEPDVLNFMLYTRPFQLSDMEEQILSRLEKVQNRTYIRLANRLYYDPKTKRPKKGAQNKKESRTPGTLRRLEAICEQYGRTYDLYSKDVDEFYDMLPSEFNRWKNSSE